MIFPLQKEWLERGPDYELQWLDYGDSRRFNLITKGYTRRLNAWGNGQKIGLFARGGWDHIHWINVI